MRTWLATVAIGASLVGCATTHSSPKTSGSTPRASVAAEETPKPAELGGDVVKIVARRPPAKQYKYVGRIEATATTGDFVDAAIAADADLRRQARALGANVVKLDVIAPPRDNARPHKRVILAGRAYRSVVN